MEKTQAKLDEVEKELQEFNRKLNAVNDRQDPGYYEIRKRFENEIEQEKTKQTYKV